MGQPSIRQLDISLERDIFLRNLLRELSGTLEELIGIEEASGYISIVGQKIADWINEDYRTAAQLETLPVATLTIRYQIQEMLRIEKTFDSEGIQDELDAYNPLIPDGSNLKATQLIEFADPEERKVMLEKLVALEHKTYIQVFGHERVYAIADEDMERSTENKTSAVHFMRFELTPEMIATLKGGAALGMGVDHPEYKHHLEEVTPETQTALVADLK
jgi:hypothetical protein